VNELNTRKPQISSCILACDGDSSDIDVWSNIPFLLRAEIEKRGIHVVPINLQNPVWNKRLWRYTLGLRHKLRHWDTSIDFYRSRTNFWLTTRKLNRAIRQHGGPNTILINLSISSAPTRSSIPVVLLSDWSYHHYITQRLGRQPDRAECGTIARDTAAMVRSSLVVLLFPESAARLQSQIPEGRFRFLGHVINDHPLAPPPPHQSPAATAHRPWRLLFVGRPRYQQGLELLLQALALLPGELSVQLDVIGIARQDLPADSIHSVPVRLHGYLSKADPEQRQLYYNLLNQADLMINASSLWAGFSATVEAMHRRTAVLTAPYAEFQALFGETPAFGAYLSALTPDALAAAIANQLHDPLRLAQQQQAAHQAVEAFTWQAFVDRLLQELAALQAEQPMSAPVPSAL
jgi:glycosyltransferase involved in cell wall biosynthesis